MVVPLAKPRWIARIGKISLLLLSIVILVDFFEPVLISRATGLDVEVLNSYRLRRHIFVEVEPEIDENLKQYVFQAEDNPPHSTYVTSSTHGSVAEPPHTSTSASHSSEASVHSENPHHTSISQNPPQNTHDEEPITALALVTKPSSSRAPFQPYPHSQPYNGTMYHISSSVHPHKDLPRTTYQLSSVWFIEQEGFDDWVGRDVQARLPPSANYLKFACIYTSPNGSSEEVRATVNKQARNEYLLLECEMPSWVREQLDLTNSPSIRASGLDLFKDGLVTLESRFDLSSCEVENSISGGHDSTHLAWRQEVCSSYTLKQDKDYIPGPAHTISPSDWSSASPTSPLSICVSPVRLQPLTDTNEVPLKHILEWRVWHMYQGVDRVHWYSRDPQFHLWIDQLNSLLGLQDTYLDAPVLSDNFPENGKNYADQAVYTADCLMRYGFSDKFQAYIDLDEFLTIRQDPSRNATLKRLDRLSDKVGSLAADHTYYGGDLINFDPGNIYQSDTFPPNAWTHWDTLEKHDGFRRQKSIHRTEATKMLWVHSSVGLGAFYTRLDETRSDSGENQVPGLEILHNRNPKHDKLTFDIPVDPEVSEMWKEAWDEMAGILSSRDLVDLHTFRISSSA